MSPRGLAAAYVALLLSAAPMAQTKPATDPVAQMEQALAKNPDDPKINIALALAYFDRGEHARALERLQHAVKVAPDSSEAYNWLGVVLLDRADFPQGIAALRKAVATHPKYTRA